ncbi:MAG: WD40 repeat domain-containing protein [Planctomycetota bacterium]|jgi:WD40 repeat protein
MIISYFRSKKIPLWLLALLLLLGLLYLTSFIIFIKMSSSDEYKYLYSKVPSTDIHYLEIETKVDMGTISTVRDTLMAAGKDGNLYLWDWRELSKEPKIIELDSQLLWLPRWHRDSLFAQNEVYALLTQKWIIHPSHDDVDMVLEDDLNLIVRDVEGQKEVNRWTVKGFFCEQLRSTRNGKFVAVLLDDDMDSYVEGVSRHGIDHRGYRLGLIGPSPTDIQWLPTFFRGEHSLPNLYAVAASEDGNYVCIVGNSSGGWIMLADVVRKKIVWEKSPKREDILYGRWTVVFNGVCFSPDGIRIYVAGNCGLFCFETATGKIIKQWPTPRVLSVAVSPDERLVAIGEEGYHSVYICDVNSANPVGKPILELDTGQYSPYSLAFSPDSKFLATEGILNTNIKIWKMPPPALEKKTTTQKNE